jgi:hypothetical protein
MDYQTEWIQKAIAGWFDSDICPTRPTFASPYPKPCHSWKEQYRTTEPSDKWDDTVGNWAQYEISLSLYGTSVKEETFSKSNGAIFRKLCGIFQNCVLFTKFSIATVEKEGFI